VGFRYYQFLIGLLATASLSYANPILFTFQGIGSGSVGAVGFTNASFTLTQSSDTSLITSFSNGFALTYETPPASGASIAIAGFGSGILSTVTDVADVQQSPSSFVALAIASTGGDVAGRGTTFDTYNLESAVGPIITPSQFVSNFTVASTLGGVSFTSISNLTFTATTVPEPSTIPLLGAGLLLELALSRRPRSRCH